ncbi:MAG: heme-binding domain-containing protein [Acidobacteria bacterium]|nr:heme-binding domain-containing protein [Acidobacteriota bacterium]
MKRTTAGLVCAGSVVMVAAAFAFGQPRNNPPVDPQHSIEVAQQVPADVGRMLSRACMDCHSYETRWPWYARIAPMSLLVERDVERSRRALNFSEWTVGAGKRPGTALGALMASCVAVQSGRMPLRPYRMLHKDAHLSAAEKTAFCSWATDTATHYRRPSTVARAH